MKRISFLFTLILSFFAGMSSADVIDTANITKSVTDEYLANGEHEGDLIWSYSVNGTEQFRVVASLTEMVDGMIEIANETGMALLHEDDDVTYFITQMDVANNLVLVEVDGSDDEDDSLEGIVLTDIDELAAAFLSMLDYE